MLRHISRFLIILFFSITALLSFPTLIRRVETNIAMVRLSKQVVGSGVEMLEVSISEVEKSEIAGIFPEQVDNNKFQNTTNYHQAQLAFWAGDYEVVLSLIPGLDTEQDLLSYFLKGHALWKLDKHEEAAEVWRSLPNVNIYFYTRSLQAEYQRDYGLLEKISYQQLVLGLDRRTAESSYRYALAMQLIPKPDVNPAELDQTVRDAIRFNLEVERRLLRMGAALTEQRYLELAKECLEPSLELGQTSYWSRFQLGLVYYLLKDYSPAIDQFLSTLRINPEFGRAHLYLARAYSRIGLESDSIPYYREAIRLLPYAKGLELELDQVIKKVESNG